MNLDLTRGQSYGVKHLLSPKSGTLVEAIQAELDLEATQILKLIHFGSIYVDGTRCTENMQIKLGSYVRVHQNPRRFPIENFDLRKTLLFENEDFLIVDKPAGLPVHPTVDNAEENLAFLLSQSLKIEVLVTHRLDVATSGLLIYAKSKKSQSLINSLFSEGLVKKIYRCLVGGSVEASGEINHWMEPSPRAPKVVSPVEREGWSHCKLRIIDSERVRTPLAETELTELKIELITGRTHQIRAQLSNLGHPLFGDRAYGSSYQWENYEKIALQCCYLGFPSLNLDSPEENFSFHLQHRPWS